jgi:hypothetical protein
MQGSAARVRDSAADAEEHLSHLQQDYGTAVFLPKHLHAQFGDAGPAEPVRRLRLLDLGEFAHPFRFREQRVSAGQRQPGKLVATMGVDEVAVLGKYRCQS